MVVLDFELIDNLLYNESRKMETPEFNTDLGTIVYLSSRYLHSNDLNIKVKAQELLNIFINKFSSYEYSQGVLTGFEGVFWSLKYMEKCNIITDSSELLKDLEQELIKSIEMDFLSNNFELYYGFIGKLQYFLIDKIRLKENKIEALINDSIKILWDSKLNKNGQYYWLDKEREDEKEIVDLGIAHGITAVFLFMIRLKELSFKNPFIDKLTEGILKTIINSTNKIGVESTFPDVYSINSKNEHLNFYNSRLGFCTGDLPVAYSLFYYGIVYNDNKIISEAKTVTNSITKRDITSSSLLHLYDFDFFDVGFCHGISSILFMLSRINQWYEDENLKKRTNYWKSELIKNTNKLLSVNKPITYSSKYNKFDEMFELEKFSFLEGICGAGLVLTAVENNDYTIGNFLNLY